MPRNRPLPAALSTGPFTVSDAVSAGVGLGRLRGRDLERPFAGVRRRTGGPPMTVLDRCRAKLLVMQPGQVFSHVTACRLLGITVPVRLRDEGLDVAAFLPSALPRARGVRGHRLAASGIRTGTFEGLPIVSPEDAWCQLAVLVSLRELIVAGDALLRRQEQLSTIERMRAAVGRRRGYRGHRTLEAALEEVRPNTDSPAETELRLDLVAFGLPEPIVNHRILGPDGRLIAIGDLAYPAFKVLAEYDGEQHRLSDTQFARDIERLDDLARAGWRVIRITKQHTGAKRTVQLRRVHEALVVAGWTAFDP